ncbi:MAG: serine hydrolase [Sneathiella sp.]|nr:serine hydrolase [Sneathiella sp.]
MTGATGVLTNSPIIDRWIDDELLNKRLSGGVLDVTKGHEILYQRVFGTKDIDQENEMTRDTIFWIASMTKPIVCATALTFLEQGKLSLESPISKYISAYKNAVVQTSKGHQEGLNRQATILDLFRHTSGVTYGQFGDGEIHKAYVDTAVYDFSNSNAEMAEKLSKIPLLYQPGEVFEYGMSTDLLGFIIECIADQSLAEIVRQRVLDPLGMTSTSFFPDTSDVVKTPPFISHNIMMPPLGSDQKWHSGGGGLWSTLPDYKIFATMLKNNGAYGDVRILKPETISLLRHNHFPKGIRFGTYTSALGITAPTQDLGLGFGLGLAVREHNQITPPGFKGEFFWPGVSGTNFWVDPANDLIVVFMTYSPEHRGQHRIDLRNAVYASLAEENCIEAISDE